MGIESNASIMSSPAATRERKTWRDEPLPSPPPVEEPANNTPTVAQVLAEHIVRKNEIQDAVDLAKSVKRKKRVANDSVAQQLDRVISLAQQAKDSAAGGQWAQFLSRIESLSLATQQLADLPLAAVLRKAK